MAQSWVSEGSSPGWAGEAPGEAGQGHQNLTSISCIQSREETKTRTCSRAGLKQKLLHHGTGCGHLATALAPESTKGGWNKACESINQLPWYTSSPFLTYFEIKKKTLKKKENNKDMRILSACFGKKKKTTKCGLWREDGNEGFSDAFWYQECACVISAALASITPALLKAWCLKTHKGEHTNKIFYWCFPCHDFRDSPQGHCSQPDWHNTQENTGPAKHFTSPGFIPASRLNPASGALLRLRLCLHFWSN